ncbi:conserved hypothetical protein [Thiomonas sp. CB3]|nr:conserved hypothetical protein [Thiomonas sp. CB3]
MPDLTPLFAALRLPLWVLLLAYLTWGLFLAAMSLVTARRAKTLPRAALILGYPLVGVGALCDMALQLVATAVFMDLPHEVFLTQRCGRYIAGPPGWRRTAALWICRNLLDPFQLGGHCSGSQPAVSTPTPAPAAGPAA